MVAKDIDKKKTDHHNHTLPHPFPFTAITGSTVGCGMYVVRVDTKRTIPVIIFTLTSGLEFKSITLNGIAHCRPIELHTRCDFVSCVPLLFPLERWGNTHNPFTLTARTDLFAHKTENPLNDQFVFRFFYIFCCCCCCCCSRHHRRLYRRSASLVIIMIKHLMCSGHEMQRTTASSPACDRIEISKVTHEKKEHAK